MDINSNQLRGTRKLSRGYYKSKIDSKKWQGLPPGVQRGQLMQVLRRIGPAIDVQAELIQRLDTLVAISKDQDWSFDTRPIVCPRNDWLMKEWNLSKSQVQRTLGSLQELGLIVAKDSPSGRRYWKRDGQGKLIVAYGFDLSPLAIRYEEMVAQLEKREAEFEARKLLKQRFTVIRRELYALFVAVCEGRLPYADLNPSEEAYRSHMERYDGNAPLPQLEQFLVEFEAFQTATEKKIEDLILEEEKKEKEAQAKIKAKSIENNNKNPDGSTDATDILNTNLPSNSKSSNRDSQESVVSSIGNNPTGLKQRSGNNNTSRLEAALQRLPGVIDATNKKSIEQPAIQIKDSYTTGIEKLQPRTIMAAAKPNFCQWIENPKNPSWREIVFAGEMTAKSLQMSDTDWRYAAHKIGPHAASVAVMIVSSRSSNVNNLSGYLRGMVKKADDGELHLHKSVFGILAQNEALEGSKAPALL